MPTEITIGPPVLTINQGATFMVTDLNGEVRIDSELGLFSNDTRFLSHYEIYANGERWQRLTSGEITYYSARVYRTNPEFETMDGVIPSGSLALLLTRSIAEGVHEDLEVTNHNLAPVRFNLEIAIRSDFADIFEVKAAKFVRRGKVETHWQAGEDGSAPEVHTSYTNQDFRRAYIYRIPRSDSRPHFANGRVTFDIQLAPGATWRSCCLHVLVTDGRESEPRHSCDVYEETDFDALQRQWMESTTRLTSPNEEVYRLYRRSVEDIGALRLHDHDFAPDIWLPAAGVPWFVTIFGRDSIIVSLQSMIVYPGLALGTLKKLAHFQAKEMDDWRDAEPGKIPHEIRFGELAHFKRIPHTPYYGTADATTLYLILLHETWKWLGDDAILKEYRDVAEGCLQWIDKYGDLDGDGFQEYQTRSAKGYEDVCWKDAGDAIVYPDGSQVRPPKALCELQGYVFDAWMRMAEVFDALGDAARAADLRTRAAELQARFEEAFWREDVGFYAFTLDADKKAVPTISSNPGHLLWSGIARPDRAERVVRRMLEPDMWSGWGIRTLSALNPAYNPFSYQRGSVWPHDNSIIAAGFARYGFHDQAASVARDISEAGESFQGHRLPELYAGIERRPGSFPVLYPGANVPQAWAAGSVFLFLQCILGLRADAPRARLYVDPHLPSWLPDIALDGITVGSATLGIRFWRQGDDSCWEILRQDGDVTVEQSAWLPWQTGAAG